MPLAQRMKQIDTGITPYVWATDSNQDVYYLNGSSFEQVAGKLVHVSSGEAGVWGVDAQSKIFFREGVEPGNPTGSEWKNVKGGLLQIDSGPKGIVCGVSSSFKPYCRSGITEVTPTGTKWQRISGSLTYISCGTYGCWGVNKYNKVYFASEMKGWSTKWMKIGCDRMVQIEAGAKGRVWALNADSELYTRLGVNKTFSSGFSWKKIGSEKFISATIGQSNVYAVDVQKKVYAGSIVPEESPGLLGVFVLHC